ncbi:Hsp33 family molecular chaperone HslO [Paenibacillus koleovorans]|uniref:Hsp33 family molecular chaperone HslO n=1 Tax=Paenibacillus koleovorans TaxID=121608 RepID=UPI000FDBE368|nr:Hsp33 family molecular chaperone HslO [Paenibacillus koleovorans]
MQQDYLIRATALNGQVRAFAANMTGILEELRARHHTTPVATAALGRTLTAGAMMGAMLKGEEKLTIRVKGDGPIGQIVVDANASGEVRGYVDDPSVELPLNAVGKLDVSGAVGREGFIYIIKDLGLKEPYSGSTPIVSGELGEDFTYYFAKSEQTPSAVALGVLVDTDRTVRCSGGFIIQLLPGLSDDEIGELEARLSGLPPVTTLMDEGKSVEEILEVLLDDVVIRDRMELKFRCKCSQERVEQTLLSLGRDEIQGLLEDQGEAEVVCHFCNEKYHFTGEELQGLVEQLS